MQIVLFFPSDVVTSAGLEISAATQLYNAALEGAFMAVALLQCTVSGANLVAPSAAQAMMTRPDAVLKLNN